MKNKNYMKEVAALLGVELGEHFKIIDENGNAFKNEFILHEDGAAEYLKGYEDDGSGAYMNNVSTMVYLLTGRFRIQKLPFKPDYNQEYWSLFVDENNLAYADITYWYGDSQDYARYYSGICFRNKEEAEVNKDKLEKMIKDYKNGED